MINFRAKFIAMSVIENRILAIALLGMLPICFGATYFGNLEIERVVGVYDGDTVKVDIKDVHPLIGKSILIRLSGIDTPEIRDKRYQVKVLAYNAKYFLEHMVRAGHSFELRNVKRGKYFRIVGELYINGVNINERLVERGFAKKYDGGKKPVW